MTLKQIQHLDKSFTPPGCDSNDPDFEALIQQRDNSIKELTQILQTVTKERNEVITKFQQLLKTTGFKFNNLTWYILNPSLLLDVVSLQNPIATFTSDHPDKIQGKEDYITELTHKLQTVTKERDEAITKCQKYKEQLSKTTGLKFNNLTLLCTTVSH